MNVAINPELFAAALFQIPSAGAGAASSWTPSNMFAGWSEDGTNITVPLAAFPGLTAALADATEGDARQVIASFCKGAFDWYNALETQPEAVVVAYKPGRMGTTGDFERKQEAEFKITVRLDSPDGLVTDEPEA